MSNKSENPYNALEKIFHEPNRLAIMSALCRSTDGMTFNELKEECDLTDGNLSRHLKALEDAKAVKIKKAFVKAKPQTTVLLSENGRENFIEYLKALEEVLQAAAQAAAPDKKKSSNPLWGGKTSTA
jgi:DNA-binding transcriptional ArsR family regulator